MYINNDIKLDFKDVLIRPKRSTLTSRNDVNIEKCYTFPISGKTFRGIPIIAANMDHIGTFEMSAVLEQYGMLTALHKHYSYDSLYTHYKGKTIPGFFDFYSLGITEKDHTQLTYFYNKMKRLDPMTNFKICIDVANGYQEVFVDFVKKIRDEFPEATIMAGNIVTGEMVEHLLLSGADIVKVGIGPGSVCTTRIKTGVGFPQLSAIIECADSAHGLKGLICADGGCTVPGDIAKAFGAGADFVMLGGMLSGHDECNGEVKQYQSFNIGDLGPYEYPVGEKYMEFYGMSSDTAMERYYGKVEEYRASEGKTIRVSYKGPVKDTIQEILGGLRSALTYTGSLSLKELPKRTTFIRVTQQSNEIFGKN